MLDEFDSNLDDELLGTTMLRANMCVGVTATVAGALGTIAGLVARPLSFELPAVAFAVPVAIMVLGGGLFVFVARRAPAALVKRFARQVAARREKSQKLVIISGKGATALGAATFLFAFALTMLMPLPA